MKKIFVTVLVVMTTSCASHVQHQNQQFDIPDSWATEQEKNVMNINYWWSQFNDPVLMSFINEAQKNNPSVSKSLALIDKARADNNDAYENYFPSVTSSFSYTKNSDLKAGATKNNIRNAALDSSWELDLFGRIRKSNDVTRSYLSARRMDELYVRLSLISEVARTYFDYKFCRLKLQQYENVANSYSVTNKLMSLRVDSGLDAKSDFSLAKASLAENKNNIIEQNLQCESDINSLSELVGEDYKSVNKKLDDADYHLPNIIGFNIIRVPSSLIRERPDILSAEDELKASGLQVDLAKLERWPDISIGSSLSLEKSKNSSTSIWGIGPVIKIPLLNVDNINGDIARAHANEEIATANYHAVVAAALKEVNQDLIELNSNQKQLELSIVMAQEYRDYFDAINEKWKIGSAAMLELETSRRQYISAEISNLEIEKNRINAWIRLYKAVGGGWVNNEDVISESFK